jgi:hypothetical protein
LVGRAAATKLWLTISWCRTTFLGSLPAALLSGWIRPEDAGPLAEAATKIRRRLSGLLHQASKTEDISLPRFHLTE